MKIQVLHIWCKCASVVLKRGYISEMSLSIACSKKKKKKKRFIAFCRRVKPWYNLGYFVAADAFDWCVRNKFLVLIIIFFTHVYHKKKSQIYIKYFRATQLKLWWFLAFRTGIEVYIDTCTCTIYRVISMKLWKITEIHNCISKHKKIGPVQ